MNPGSGPPRKRITGWMVLLFCLRVIPSLIPCPSHQEVYLGIQFALVLELGNLQKGCVVDQSSPMLGGKARIPAPLLRCSIAPPISIESGGVASLEVRHILDSTDALNGRQHTNYQILMALWRPRQALTLKPKPILSFTVEEGVCHFQSETLQCSGQHAQSWKADIGHESLYLWFLSG